MSHGIRKLTESATVVVLNFKKAIDKVSLRQLVDNIQGLTLVSWIQDIKQAEASVL